MASAGVGVPRFGWTVNSLYHSFVTKWLLYIGACRSTPHLSGTLRGASLATHCSAACSFLASQSKASWPVGNPSGSHTSYKVVDLVVEPPLTRHQTIALALASCVLFCQWSAHSSKYGP